MDPVSKRGNLVGKQHDDQAADSRKKWFKDFFLKKSKRSYSRSAYPIALPSLKKLSKSQTALKQAHKSPREGNQTAVSHQPLTKFHKFRVKGRRRLFKYHPKPVRKTHSHQVTTSLPSALHNQDKNIRSDNNQGSHKRTTSSSGTDNDILQRPSGLRMPISLRRRLSKIKGKEKLNKKNVGCHKGRKSQDTRSGKEHKKTGISRGCLESYGFRARAPK
jgi:hypothetical protein